MGSTKFFYINTDNLLTFVSECSRSSYLSPYNEVHREWWQGCANLRQKPINGFRKREVRRQRLTPSRGNHIFTSFLYARYECNAYVMPIIEIRWPVTHRLREKSERPQTYKFLEMKGKERDDGRFYQLKNELETISELKWTKLKNSVPWTPFCSAFVRKHLVAFGTFGVLNYRSITITGWANAKKESVQMLRILKN